MVRAKSTKQVAKETGLSQRTVQRRAKQKKIKASKPGHDIIVTGNVSAKKGKPGPKKKGKRK